MQTRKRLGDILSEMGVVDGLQLQSALAYQRKWGVPLGQVVVDMRFCTAQQVLEALARQAGVETLDLDAELLEPGMAELVPRRLAEMHRVVPLRLEGPRSMVLVVAIAAPASLHSLDAVRSVSRKARVVAKLASDAAISRAIERLYGAEAPARLEQESILLPEADADMQLNSGCMAALTEDGGFDEARAILLPDLNPEREALELPLLEPLDVEELAGILELTEELCEPEPETGGVLVYGWGAAAAAGLVRVLGAAGHRASVASTEQVLAAGEGAVVLSPLPSLEVLEQRPRAQLLVAGKVPELDVVRAQALGARGFLVAPLDTDLMLRAVKRLMRPAEEAPRLRAAS
ncbi:general secretion pathway protein GspE [Vitiosangium sp. GDMCC 1.1324]|uniref:GspE/PulE/PilB domain-containing protein n=1 Tax=Vitiosangium sp. (strain GDMCC 1.1324) TaxID=2138576 RepID=UPI000D38361A|nr:general secretion pathway protein GspE [Vitiosangium sp. GDMCC 1.1324]PTL77141.1 general secretion pathway protein GspE [Vitiosangium sp. GDMCC 1.1324]